ncbi:MAG: hypothetical protein CMA09_05590 [Euryarchaeota archaeon]|nr:hypothetical protein [Euryarchaeota archaeon]
MGETFPSLHGRNLNKQDVAVPDDYSDKNLIVFAAFQQWHQPDVDHSIALLEQNNMQQSYHIIEVPVIQKSTWFRQLRLDTIMRAGIRAPHIRQRTVTVYLDKAKFCEQLNIANDNSIHWFVIAHSDKQILLRGEGKLTREDLSQIQKL